MMALILALGWSGIGVAADEVGQGKEGPDESQTASEYELDVGRADGADLEEIEPEAFSEDEEYSDVEEIKVTGAQGGQLVQAAVSEIGFDAYELQRDGIKDIRDLSNFTPNLEIKSAFAASNATLFIRGVGIDDFNANAPSAVSVYQDDIYMQSPAGQLFQFFDVEGVDVLRGPQGVLFRNASAGVIHVISRKPSDTFNLYSNVTYGRFNQVDVEGAVGGPITDSLSARVSGTWSVRDGISQNRCAVNKYLERPLNPDPPPDYVRRDDSWACYQKIVWQGHPLTGDVVERVNDTDTYAARGQLLWKAPVPEGEMEWHLNVHGGQYAGQAYQYQSVGVNTSGFNLLADGASIPIVEVDPNTGRLVNGTNAAGYSDQDGDPWAGDYNVQGPENLDLWGAYLKGTWEFGDGYKLKSVTGYEGHKRFTREDSDASPAWILMSDYEDEAWQVTQELRLEGQMASPAEFGEEVDWVLGAYYLKEDLSVTNTFAYLGPLQIIDYKQNLRNFSVYGMATWVFLENFELQAGARQNWEQKSFDIRAFAKGQAAGSELDSKAGYEQGSFTGWGGNVTLTYQVLAEARVSIKYSRGWKGGHFNGGAFSSQALIEPVRPETVDSFELHGDSSWLDGRLIVNGSFFVYDYKDLQVFQLEQTTLGSTISQLINAEHARIYGAELDVQAEPVDGLNMEFHFAWLDSYYRDFRNSLDFSRNIGCPPRACQRVDFTHEFDYSGNRLIAAPKFSIAAAVDYSLPLPNFQGRDMGYLTPRFSLTWKDSIYFDACSGRGAMCNFPTGTFGEDAVLLMQASLGWWSADERFQILLWVQNLTDQIYLNQSFDQSGSGMQNILEIYGAPRTFGVTFGVYY